MEFDKVKKSVLLLLCASNLFFFVLAYYFFQDHSSLQEQLQDMTVSRDTALSENVALQSEIKLLQNQLSSRSSAPRDSDQEIANLEKLLDFRDEELQQLKKQLDGQPPDNRNAPAARQDRERFPRRGNMRERMERLKAENPEEYERMQARMNEFQKQREEQSARRELFFKNLDVSKLSKDQRRIVSDYQELLAANEEMVNSMWQGGERPNFQEMMEQGRAIREMSETVREILLQNLGNQIGIGGENLSDNVQEILEMTSMGNMGRFGGRGRPR
jgi:chromosome segregation ATPase